MSHYILNDNGDVTTVDDVIEWARQFETAERHMGDNEVNGVRVSTVFLGVDHSFGEGPPLLFETMVFGGERGEAQERYPTKAAAIAGHAKWVNIVKRESKVTP